MKHMTVYDNILDVTEGIITHQVNCRGVMGSGVAGQIRKKYPQVFSDYRGICDSDMFSTYDDMLGYVVTTKISDKLYICSIFGQSDYGNDGTKYTSYDALDMGFSEVEFLSREHNLNVHYPKIGAGLGGGRWSIIKAIVETNVTNGIYHDFKV